MVGPTLIAQVRQATGQYHGALRIIALITFLSAIVPLLLHRRFFGGGRPRARAIWPASAGGSLPDGEWMRVGVRIPLRGFVKALKVLLDDYLDS